VARAVEVNHVKVLRYRPKTADLLMAAGLGWKEGLVRVATFSSDLRSAPGRSFQTAESVCIADTANAPGFVISEISRSTASPPLLTYRSYSTAPHGACSKWTALPTEISAMTRWSL
jgi:hypothetical protein